MFHFIIMTHLEAKNRYLTLQVWGRLGVTQVEPDLRTILDESWELTYCRYVRL